MIAGRLVVFLTSPAVQAGLEGPILYAEPPLAASIHDHNGTDNVGDLNFEEAETELRGLVVFEGWIEESMPHDDSSEPYFVGDWRKLDHWEMCKVREGLAPWETEAAKRLRGKPEFAEGLDALELLKGLLKSKGTGDDDDAV